MKFISRTLSILAVGIFIFVFWAQLELVFTRLVKIYLPCRQPIAYHIASFDERFGISEKEFLLAIAQAEAVWEKPLGRELFASSSDGLLAINLIYDERQEATMELRALGLEIDDTRASYDALKKQYALYEIELKKERAAYEELVRVFEERQDAYNAEVEKWNKEGGAPKPAYERLKVERARLDADLVKIRQAEEKLNTIIKDANAFVVVLNRQAVALNIDVGKFNEVNTARGEEFNEGVYQSDSEGERIEIYQFDSQEKLVRVLAHELGHALGLEHVDDPKAIMYRLNQGSTETPTASDLAALRATCKIQ